MGLRLFISCDLCNPRGFSITEDRRIQSRHSGRRSSDGRAALVGPSLDSQHYQASTAGKMSYADLMAEAKNQGWYLHKDGYYFCDHCYQRHKDLLQNFEGELSELADAIFEEAHQQK